MIIFSFCLSRLTRLYWIMEIKIFLCFRFFFILVLSLPLVSSIFWRFFALSPFQNQTLLLVSLYLYLSSFASLRFSSLWASFESNPRVDKWLAWTWFPKPSPDDNTSSRSCFRERIGFYKSTPPRLNSRSSKSHWHFRSCSDSSRGASSLTAGDKRSASFSTICF